jgi:hypothetical protein
MIGDHAHGPAAKATHQHLREIIIQGIGLLSTSYAYYISVLIQV